MIENIGGVTSQLVNLALDVASLRQQVIAHNIANANTSGYQPQKVSFENILEQASVLTMDSPTERQLTEQLKSIERKLHNGDLIEDINTNSISLDEQMVELTENVIQYKALLEARSKFGSLVKMAINEGK
ncbi:flagellar basal-body rod protein FlgB [Candidatus Thiodiazotropha endoloripes]|uniref:flagellar basal body rod protein FlgB n=1 Tax=Candidatus Thiodiazotropha endoloripes TaxID=1818881 RepID=UPI00083D3E20|nr:flagellar basal body rod protein FlgB [Candidatus Thiodiazotropha endoloripes]ODB85642.1 flagellar basal-body rod protein FlgB [Candidatus Thiodiazotropha endoloripes]